MRRQAARCAGLGPLLLVGLAAVGLLGLPSAGRALRLHLACCPLCLRCTRQPRPALPLCPAPQFVATHEVQLGGQQPVLLHGGGLLGVVLNKPQPSGTGAWALPGAGWLLAAGRCRSVQRGAVGPSARASRGAATARRSLLLPHACRLLLPNACAPPRLRRPRDAVCQLEGLWPCGVRAARAGVGQVRLPSCTAWLLSQSSACLFLLHALLCDTGRPAHRPPPGAAGSPSARWSRWATSTPSSCAARGPRLNALHRYPSPPAWRVRRCADGARAALRRWRGAPHLLRSAAAAAALLGYSASVVPPHVHCSWSCLPILHVAPQACGSRASYMCLPPPACTPCSPTPSQHSCRRCRCA